MLAAIVLLVGYLAVTRRDVQQERPLPVAVGSAPPTH